MSVDPIVQTAPERRGIIGDADNTSVTGTSDATSHGSYNRDTSQTYTMTVDTAGTSTIGTTASIQVSWSDTDGNTGMLEVGTDSGYAAGDEVAVDGSGLYVSFSSGTLVASDSVTIDCVAGNFLDHEHVSIETDEEPTRAYIIDTGPEERDILLTTDRGDILREERTMARAPTLLLDYLQDAQLWKWRRMVHNRHRITLAENYDDDTVLLFRGGGLLPLIGPEVSFSRTGDGSYLDPDTNLWTLESDDDVLRVTEGPCGPAFHVGNGWVNADSEPFPTGSGSGAARGWNQHTATVTFDFDTNKKPPLHPDGGWTAAQLAGSLRCYMSASSAISTNTEPATSSGSTYSSSVYIAGRGSVRVAIYTDPGGGGTPDTELVGQDVDLDSMDWQRICLTGAPSGSETARHIRITADEQTVLWASAKTQQTGETCGNPFDGTTAAETWQLRNFTLPQTGTLSMWFWVPPGNITDIGTYSLFEETSAGHFFLRYDSVNDRFRVGFTSGTIMNASVSGGIVQETWNHVVFTWKYDAAAANEVEMSVYHQGSLLNSNDLAWSQPPDVSSAVYAINDSATGEQEMEDWRFAEIRIDGRAWTAAEVSLQYSRFTDNEWMHLHRELAGRQFWIGSSQEQQLSTVNPDKMIVTADLVQAKVEPHSLVLSR